MKFSSSITFDNGATVVNLQINKDVLPPQAYAGQLQIDAATNTLQLFSSLYAVDSWTPIMTELTEFRNLYHVTETTTARVKPFTECQTSSLTVDGILIVDGRATIY